MAVRKQDGEILVTVATSAQIFLVSSEQEFDPIEVAVLPNVNAAIGILETCKDEFWVTGGNLSITGHSTEEGSFSIWKLDFSSGPAKARLTDRFDLPRALLPDRIMQWDERTLFISDSVLGVVWSVNTRSGAVAVVLNDTATMAPVEKIGINDLAFHEGHIYYDNSDLGEVSRIPVHHELGTATGPAEVLIRNKKQIFPQGFDLRGGELWIADGFNQVMLLKDVDLTSDLEVVAGNLNGTKFAGLTDCKFGRKAQDLERGSLYVSSDGAVDGEWVFGGSIWRVDVGRGRGRG